jgi:hypothetical protein
MHPCHCAYTYKITYDGPSACAFPLYQGKRACMLELTGHMQI